MSPSAIWGAITGVAISLGPILGGAITTGINWRGIFLVNVPVGIAAIGVTLWKVEESRAPHPGRPDWAGFLAAHRRPCRPRLRPHPGERDDLEQHRGHRLFGARRSSSWPASWRSSSGSTTPCSTCPCFVPRPSSGGLVAAFAMNGSLFAMFLYLVLYLQDILGYSALDTGLRLLVSTGGTFLAAGISGRLSEHVPVRYLIAPGLALVGVGLLVMTGLNGTSSWTHLLPGFLLAGIGAGLVNPPLASTAIGVVPPARSGMASGVNSTFRQIGFAVSIAALGSIFASALRDNLTRALASVPGLAARAPQVVTLIRQGSPAKAIGLAPPALRHQLGLAIRSSFASGIDSLMVVTAVLAFVGAIGSLVLIRRKDFLARHETRPAPNQELLATSA